MKNTKLYLRNLLRCDVVVAPVGCVDKGSVVCHASGRQESHCRTTPTNAQSIITLHQKFLVHWHLLLSGSRHGSVHCCHLRQKWNRGSSMGWRYGALTHASLTGVSLVAYVCEVPLQLDVIICKMVTFSYKCTNVHLLEKESWANSPLIELFHWSLPSELTSILPSGSFGYSMSLFPWQPRISFSLQAGLMEGSVQSLGCCWHVVPPWSCSTIPPAPHFSHLSIHPSIPPCLCLQLTHMCRSIPPAYRLASPLCQVEAGWLSKQG